MFTYTEMLHKTAADYHTVKGGDTYWGLSKKYKIPVQRLKILNKGVDPSKLQLGQKLRIKDLSPAGKSAPVAKPATGRTHQVIKGDVLGRIANKYGVSLEALMKANPSVKANRMQIGTKLTIPEATKPVIKKYTPAQVYQKFAPDWNTIIGIAGAQSAFGNSKLLTRTQKDGRQSNGIWHIINKPNSPVMQDVNRFYGTSFKPEDALDKSKAMQLLKRYIAMYGYNSYRRTGKMPTREQQLRIWNEGPAGGFRKGTTPYTDRVAYRQRAPEYTPAKTKLKVDLRRALSKQWEKSHK